MTRKNNKLWNRQYISLLILCTLTSITFNMVTPVLPKYALSIGIDLTAAGLLSGIFSVTSLIFRPISGAVADRRNRKKLLLLSMAVTVAAVIGYAFSESFAVLFAFRLLHGAAFAISSTLSMAMATEYIPDGKMGEGVGYLGLSSTLALAIGPAVGLRLISSGYMASFLVGAASTALGMALLFGVHPRENRAPARHFQIGSFISVKLIPLALLGGLFTLSGGLNTTFLSILGDERGIAGISVFFTVCSVVLVVARPASGKLTDIFGLRAVMYPAYACSMAAMLMLAFTRSLWLCIAAAVLCALGQGGGQPALQAECLRRLGREKSGVATSTFLLGADIMNGLGSIAGGAVSDSLGYGSMYLLCAVLMLSGGIGFAVYDRRQKRASTLEKN